MKSLGGLAIKTEYVEIILSEIKYSDFPLGAVFLSEKLNIPQASIGRVLAELEKKGLLEKVSNKGRQITPKGLEWLKEHQAHKTKIKSSQKLVSIVQEISKERLLEILDVRKLLEGCTVELACRNASAEDIDALEGILLDHKYAVRHNMRGSDEDLRLHLMIAKLSKNDTLYHLIELMLTGENAYDTFSAVADHITNIQIQQHADLVAAIKKKDAVAAKKALNIHLDQVISDVKKYYTE